MVEVIFKYLTGELRETETQELFRQLETDKHLYDEFIRLQNLYALAHLSTLSENKSDNIKRFQFFIHQIKIKEQHKIIRMVLRYAAIVLLLIASTFFSTKYLLGHTGNDSTMNTLTVPAGQRVQLTLQDGTSVWLNAQSTLTFPAHFTEKTRRVTVSGEAYFEVAKDNKKPFIVSTQDLEMKVLGTQFNVYSYQEADYISTDLVEGSLMVYNKESPHVSVTLKPNEQIVVKDGKMIVGDIRNADYFLWKDGIYTFKNERLLDIIEKLQLYYDVKIIVKDPEIFDVYYTGKFRQRDGIDEILRIIQKIQNFSIDKNIETNTIILRR